MAALSPLRANPGKAVSLWALLNHAAPGDVENDFWNDGKLRRFSATPWNMRAQAAAIIASSNQCGSVEDGRPLLRTTGLCGHLGSSRHVQKVKGLPCQ